MQRNYSCWAYLLHCSVLRLLSGNDQYLKAGRCSQPRAPVEPFHVVKGVVALAASTALQPKQTKLLLVALQVRIYCRCILFIAKYLISFIDSACVGAIDGAPKCADSSWSLWQGFQGNGFCCQVGLVGVYQSSGNVAGTCVASGQAGTATTARLVGRSNEIINYFRH